MRKFTAVFLMFSLTVLAASAQNKFFTKNGKIFFNASSPLEKIEATNEKATSVIDISTGAMEWAVLMKGFTFERALMQEHFNENYVESDKYPKAVFKGNITNLSEVDLKKDGTYPVKVKGTLTLHGETKDLETDGTLTVKEGNITAGKSTFRILLEDYKIQIPSVVKDKISKDVEVVVDANYDPYKAS